MSASSSSSSASVATTRTGVKVRVIEEKLFVSLTTEHAHALLSDQHAFRQQHTILTDFVTARHGDLLLYSVAGLSDKTDNCISDGCLWICKGCTALKCKGIHVVDKAYYCQKRGKRMTIHPAPLLRHTYRLAEGPGDQVLVHYVRGDDEPIAPRSQAKRARIQISSSHHQVHSVHIQCASFYCRLYFDLLPWSSLQVPCNLRCAVLP